MELHRALGLERRRGGAHRGDPRTRPQRPRAGHVCGDVERALLLQIVTPAPQTTPDRGAPCPGGPGRERRGHRRRRRHRRGLRIESHNHPSAVEPYQGAATGVGGILRDIFTMGARPIALMDPLFFGTLDDARTRWLTEGVVAGISGYGNSVGVPTIGGELTFAAGLRPQPPGERAVPRGHAQRAPGARRRHRRGEPGRAAGLDHRARRDRRRERAGLGRLRR